MKENRLFLVRMILIWLLLELVAAAQVQSAHGSSVLQWWLRSLAEPAVWTARQLATLTTEIAFGLRDTKRLLSDNQRLRNELEELRARKLLLDEDLEAYREATAVLQLSAGLEASGLAGRCSFRSLPAGRMVIRVDGAVTVRRDTPVISAGGLVGRVVHWGAGRAWVELVTHPAAAVAVQTREGRVHGLAVGSGREALAVEYVPRSAELLRGDTLVTSSADGIYPPGIPVATVTGIRESDAAFLEVRAAPAAHLNTLRVVLLLPGWAREPNTEIFR